MTSRLLLLALLPALLAADWPQLLGPTRNATSAETGLATSWPAKGPPVVWERAVGEGYSGPVIADGAMILFHRVGNDEVVEALDAATGKTRWKVAAPTAYSDALGKGDGPRATPLVAGGRVYVLGAEGRMLALELASGKKVWERELARDYDLRRSFFGIGTSPLLEGDLLLVNVGAKDAGIVAFHKDTGKEVWKATDQEASYSSPVAATIDGARHVFFFARDGLVGLDPKNGTVRFTKRWRARLNASVNAAVPVVVGDRLLLTSSYQTGAVLLKVTKDRVEEVWQNDKSLSCHYNTPVARDDVLFGIDGRQEEGARLRCIERETGKVRWEKEGFGCASLVLADGKLIAMTENGDVVLIEATADGYREKGRAKVLGRGCRAEIALSDGRLYARDGDRLVCLDLKAR